MDEKTRAAQAKLRAAIVAYYEELYPGSFIDDWTVVVHRQSVALEANNESIVSTTIPEEQPTYRTIGLLSVALDNVQGTMYDAEEE